MVDEQVVIGISAHAVTARWGVWEAEAVLLARSYVEAVARAGGVPVMLPPVPELVAGSLPRLDGLILSGGPDVDPARYGQEPGPHTEPTHVARDQAECSLVATAGELGLPLLGICRGMQLLNVARGGSLVQHLPDRFGHDAHAPIPGRYATHPVEVEPGSTLARLLGTSLPAVATYHHQGIDALGSGLRAVARSSDGLVEAVEDPSQPFLIAVQWHPEVSRDEGLFSGLVAAGRAYRSAASSGRRPPRQRLERVG